jgi:hypothetical protein
LSGEALRMHELRQHRCPISRALGIIEKVVYKGVGRLPPARTTFRVIGHQFAFPLSVHCPSELTVRISALDSMLQIVN